MVWFNLGMHHVPHTGDLPNTVYTLAHAAAVLEPFNYFERNPSSSTRQQIRINCEDGQVGSLETFGALSGNCSIALVGPFALAFPRLPVPFD